MPKSHDNTSHIPVHGRRRKVNQQGTTLVSRARHTEIAALRHPLIVLSPVLTELEKSTAIYAAYRRAMRSHHPLRGMALWLWISGVTGCLLSEVRFYLRK